MDTHVLISLSLPDKSLHVSMSWVIFIFYSCCVGVSGCIVDN